MPLTIAPQIALPEVLISTMSMTHGVGLEQLYALSSVAVTGTWPAANRALYVPLYMERPGTVTKFWTLNGSAAAGNIDIGLYREDYTLIVAKGSTAQAVTNVIQEFDVTDFGIVPGTYFLGLVLSSTSGTVFQQGPNTLSLGLFGTTQQALGSTALPSTATPAQLATGLTPVAGIAFRALVA